MMRQALSDTSMSNKQAKLAGTTCLNNNNSKVTKTYFHTQTKVFELPYDFMASKNKKYIVVQYVAAT